MKRWTTALLILCASVVCAAEWFVPHTTQALLGVLLVVLVTLTMASQHGALQTTVGSLETAHREQIDSERRYRAIFEACSDAILVWRIAENGTPQGFEEVNEAACLSLGYRREQLLALPVEDIYAPEMRRDLAEKWRDLASTGRFVMDAVHYTRERHMLFVEVNARVVEIRGRRLCLAVARNVEARKEQEERLRGMSNRDELTGLLNRRGFFGMVEEVEHRARRLGAHVLLMYIDVDGLKRVNDEMGHAAGDVLIVAAANVLRLTFRDGDVVARLGGDEFVALAVLGRSSDERLDQQTIMGRFESAIAAKRAELGDEYDFALSSGCVVATAESLHRIDDMLARTDQRMYATKHARRRRRQPDSAR